MRRVLLFLLLLPVYAVGYSVGCMVWVGLIIRSAFIEAYLIGRGNA